MTIIDHLKNIKFIGPFPQGIDVLLVSVPDAIAEAKSVDKEITRKSLLTLLRTNNIAVFYTIDDYVAYKGLKK